MKKHFILAGVFLLISIGLAFALEWLQIRSQPPIITASQDLVPEGEELDFSMAELTNAQLSGENLKTLGEGSSVLFRFEQPRTLSSLTLISKKHILSSVPIRIFYSSDGNTFSDSDRVEIEAVPESVSWTAEFPEGSCAAIRIETDGKLTFRSICLQAGTAPAPAAAESLSLRRAGAAAAILFLLLVLLRWFHAGKRAAESFRRAVTGLKACGGRKAVLRGLFFLLLCLAGYTAVRWIVSGSLFGPVDIPRQLFCALAGICAGLLAAFPETLGARPERLFVLFCLLAGWLMIFLFPNDASVNWDSEYHYEQALTYSYLGEPRLTGPDADFIQMTSSGGDPYIWEEREELHAWQEKVRAEGASYGSSELMLNSVYEIFAGTGLYLGRVLYLSWNWSLYLGKLFNLLAYAACGYFAIRRLKSGKMILACVLLIPTNLFLASTFSYDPGVTGPLALSLAYFFAEWQEPEKKLTPRRVFIMLGSAGFALLTKAFYAPVLFFMLFLPRAKWAASEDGQKPLISLGRWTTLILCTFLISLIPYLLPLLQGNMTTDMRGGSSSAPLEQVRFILADPLRWFGIMFRYQRAYFSPANSSGLLTFFAYQGMGPYWQALYALLVLLAFTDKKEADRLLERKPGARAAGLLLLYLVTCIICLCLYVSFTDTGAETISGVQPRYLLPIVFPVLMLAGSGFAAKLLRIDKAWKQQVYNGTAFFVSLTVLFCGIWTACVSKF